MNKPILLGLGLLPDRHQNLVENLSHDFHLIHLNASPWLVNSEFPVVSSFDFWTPFQSARSSWNLYRTLCKKLKIHPKHVFHIWRLTFLNCWFTEKVRKGFLRLLTTRTIHGVLAISHLNGPHKAILEEAKKKNIPTVYITHGYEAAGFNTSHDPLLGSYNTPMTQHLCVPDILMSQYFQKHLSQKSQIHITGDSMSHANHNTVPQDNSVYTVLLSTTYTSVQFVTTTFCNMRHEFDVCEKLFTQIKTLQHDIACPLLLRIKSHPTLDAKLKMPVSASLKIRAQRHGIQTEITTLPTSQALAGCNLHVSTMPSSTNYEALIQGIPTATCFHQSFRNLYKTTKQNVSFLVENGLCRMLPSEEDWLPILKDMLSSPPPQPPPPKGPETLADDIRALITSSRENS